MDNELTKLYYTIGEVSRMFGVSNSLLRYWQTEFPGLKPGKSKKGDRKYVKKDILYIEKIFNLVKVQGYTLDGARNELKEKHSNTLDKKDITNRLKAIKKGMEKLEKEL